MAVGLFNPKDNANATGTRPAHVNMGAAIRRWFTDTIPGTRISAQDLNAVIAQFRGAMDAFGVADVEGDDTALTQLLTAVFTPRRNFVRNPSFALWQAGTSFASGYIADLWKASSNTGRTYTRQAGFSGARYCLRMQRDAGNTSTAGVTAWTVLETGAALHLAGKPTAISFDVRCGANFSGAGVFARLQTGTAIDETTDAASGAFPTGAAVIQPASQAVTTTAQRLTFAISASASNAQEMAVRIVYIPTGTAGANDWIEITNVKLEYGTKSSTFLPEPIVDTLAAAYRLYQKSFDEATAPAQNAGIGTGERRFPATVAGTSVNRPGTIPFVCPMKVAPTVTLFNPAAANGLVRDISLSGDSGAPGMSITSQGFALSFAGNASTAVGNSCGVHFVADARIF